MGETIWVLGDSARTSDDSFTPAELLDREGQSLPMHCLYICRDATTKRISKAWLLTAMRQWQPAQPGMEHPVFPDRILKLTNLNGNPSWILKTSGRVMSNAKVSRGTGQAGPSWSVGH